MLPPSGKSTDRLRPSQLSTRPTRRTIYAVAGLDDHAKRPVGLNRPARAVDCRSVSWRPLALPVCFRVSTSARGRTASPPVSPAMPAVQHRAPGRREPASLAACSPPSRAIPLGSQSWAPGNRLSIKVVTATDPMMALLYRWKAENGIISWVNTQSVIQIGLHDMLTHSPGIARRVPPRLHPVGNARLATEDGLGDVMTCRSRPSMRGLHHPSSRDSTRSNVSNRGIRRLRPPLPQGAGRSQRKAPAHSLRSPRQPTLSNTARRDMRG